MHRLAVSAVGPAGALPGNNPAVIKIASVTIAFILSAL